MHQTYSVGRPGHWREEDDPEISAVIFLVLLIKVIVNMEGGRSGALGGDFSYSFLRVSFQLKWVPMPTGGMDGSIVSMMAAWSFGSIGRREN